MKAEIIAIKVDLGSRSYPIWIGSGFQPLSNLNGKDRKALLVSDSNVMPLYGQTCLTALQSAGFDVVTTTIEAGEQSKSWAGAADLYNTCAASRLDRRGLIVALGGGVTGDLAGFAAATYLRGLDLVQAPTSLLAMVDSSVGGKTGINLEAGKNLVGSFHQPVEVMINLDTLRTLPEREYCAGLAEVVKYGLILDSGFYRRLTDSSRILADREPAFLADVVARCCELKARVVKQDEFESSGQRALLNFGHTLGHAIEAWSGYGNMLHGEAISIGMIFAAYLSHKSGGLTAKDVKSIEECLDALGLPVRLPAQASDWKEIRLRMQSDKKSSGGKLRFVLLDAIGHAQANRDVCEGDLAWAWDMIR